MYLQELGPTSGLSFDLSGAGDSWELWAGDVSYRDVIPRWLSSCPAAAKHQSRRKVGKIREAAPVSSWNLRAIHCNDRWLKDPEMFLTVM